MTVTITHHRGVRCLVFGERFAALGRSRLTCSDRCRQQRSRLLRESTPAFRVGRFGLIYADHLGNFAIAAGKAAAAASLTAISTYPPSVGCRSPVSSLPMRCSQSG